MKKTIVLLLLIITAVYCHTFTDAKPARASVETVYAYLPASAPLYAVEISGDGDGGVIEYVVITQLPATYFVALIDDAAVSGDYFYVNYHDISGYVLKTDVEICDYEPVTKYANAGLTTEFDGQNVNLRSKPDHTLSGNVVLSIPSGTELLYYGTAQGSAMYPALGDKWYYVRYFNGAETVRGYIYNAQADAQTIEANVIERVERTPPAPTDTKTEPTPLKLSDTATTVLIICLCIPAVLIVLLIFRKPQPVKRVPRHYRDE